MESCRTFCIRELAVIVIQTDIMQHSTAHRNGIDLAGERNILVVRRNTGAAHDGYIAGAEAGVRRIRARHFDQRNVPNGAEKAAVPVLVGSSVHAAPF